VTRRYSAKETSRQAKAKRDVALERGEFRYPSEARVAAASPTSFPVKAEDAETRRLIDEALARRGPNRV